MKEADVTDKAAGLLIQLSRIEFSDSEKSRLRNEIELFHGWRRFTDLAVRHGVAALVWQNITDLALSENVPAPEKAILEGLRFKSIARVAFITDVAAEIVSTLDKKGIKAVLLKGLALEHTLYGSEGLRQMSDADLLVPASDVLKARDILLKRGFVSRPLKSCLYRHIILDLGNHLPELHRGGVSVDLHHRLFGPKGSDMVLKAIEEAEEININGKKFYILSPLPAFLGLTAHISKHEIKGEFQLRLYTDIYLMLKKHGDTIICKELLPAAEEAGITEKVRTVLTIMEQVWGFGIPEEMRALSGEEQRIAQQFMNYVSHPGRVRPVSRKEIFLGNLSAINGFRKKLIFITGDLFPSVGFMKRRYGCRSAFQAFFYYPHRLGKIGWILGQIFAK